MRECPFCQPHPDRVIDEAANTIALFDGYPVSEGHALVVPKQHVASVYDLPPDEQRALWDHVGVVRGLLLDRFRPQGFNIGVNDGRAAGQTVMHAHIHVIPRRDGDAVDPRGGIRWVLPAKAKYW